MCAGFAVTSVAREGGVRLWCSDTGGQGPPVVILHGLAGYAREWAASISALAPAFRVIAFDQRGHGRSTRRPGDLSREAFVNDVVAVVDRLVGTQPVILIGQSMGAHTALLVAAQHPERVDRLVLVEGGVGGDTGTTRQVSAWLAGWPLPFADSAAAAAWFREQGMSTDAAAVWAGGLERGGDGLRPAFDADVMEAALRFVEERPRWDEWARIGRPTLLVLGERSAVGREQVAEMLARNPLATAVRIPGAGHDVHLDRTQSWMRVLTDFLGATDSAH